MKLVPSLIGIGMCAMVSLIGGNTVFAQTAQTTERLAALESSTDKRLTELETKTDAPGLWKTLGFQVSGAVEASFTQNFNNPNTNLNQLRIFDTQANSFVPMVAQLMMERPATAGSAMDRIGFRARLNFGAQSRFSRARTNYQPGTDNTELDVHELYGEYIAPIGNGLKIQVGKINTLIGLEAINSWENPNYFPQLDVRPGASLHDHRHPVHLSVWYMGDRGSRTRQWLGQHRGQQQWQNIRVERWP